METFRSFKPDLTYLSALIGAGVTGISAARHEAGSRIFTPPLKSAVWTPLAIGATVGAVSSRLSGNRKASRIAIGGLMGSLVGVSAALAWSSRRFTASAARSAIKLVNNTRDAHWLESHPIDYA